MGPIKSYLNEHSLNLSQINLSHDKVIEVIDLIYQETDGNLPIDGVGGIESKETAWNAITSGASLIQLYSALVFNGPSVASSIVKGLKKHTKENN